MTAVNVSGDGGNMAAGIDNASYVLLAFAAPLVVCIIISNLSLTALLIVTRNLGQQGVYILSLTVADLMLGVTVHPFALVSTYYRRWIFSDGTCAFSAFTLGFFSMASLLSMALLSLDRYVAVYHSNFYQTWLTTRCSAVIVAMASLIAFIVNSGPLFGFSAAEFSISAKLCVATDSRRIINYIQFIYLTGMYFSILAVNVRLLKTAHHHSRAIMTLSSAVQGAEVAESEHQGRMMRGVRTVICIFAVLFITWTPVLILQVISAASETLNNAIPSVVKEMCVYIYYSNSLWNTIIYCRRDENIRSAIRRHAEKLGIVSAQQSPAIEGSP